MVELTNKQDKQCKQVTMSENTYLILIFQSGFGIHPVTASNEAWDEVLKVSNHGTFAGIIG